MMKIGKTEIKDEEIVKEKARKMTSEQAKSLAKNLNGMATEKEETNKNIRDFVNRKK